MIFVHLLRVLSHIRYRPSFLYLLILTCEPFDTISGIQSFQTPGYHARVIIRFSYTLPRHATACCERGKSLAAAQPVFSARHIAETLCSAPALVRG